MTFGEIDAGIKKLLEECVNAETGEIIAPDEDIFMARLDEFYNARDEKIDGMVGAYKYYMLLADGIKAEKMALAKRQQIAEHRAESIKTFLSHLLNGEKVEKPSYKIGWRKSEKAVVDIPVEDLFPIYRKVEYKADLVAIKSALKEGATINGCRLVESNNINIK